MDVLYRRTQWGWPLIAIAVGVCLVIVPLFLAYDLSVQALVVPSLLAVVLLLFGSLTVELRPDVLRIRFGIGAIRRRWSVEDIRSVRAVTNRWYYGWGIRFTPYGWLYNVSGLQAVELETTTSVVRIGTDDPEGLVAALRVLVGDAVSPTADRAQDDVTGTRWPAVAVPLGVVLALVVVMGTAVYSNMGDPTVSLMSDRMTVVGVHGSPPLVVSAAKTTSIEMVESLPRARKVNGFSFGGHLRGRFDVDGLGEGRLMVDRGAPPFILVRTTDGYLVFNYRDPSRTRQLFSNIRTEWKR